MHNQEDEKIIKLLESMPKVKDDQHQEELFQQISMHLPKNSSKRRKTKVFLYSALAAALLLAVGLPMYFSNESSQPISDQDYAGEQAESFITAQDSFDGFEESEEMEGMDEQFEIKLFEERAGVVHEISSDQQFIHFATHDETGQFVIPFVQVVSGDVEFVENYLSLNEILTSYGFQKNDFDITHMEWNLESNELFITIKADDGRNELDQSLHTLLQQMFSPYRFEKLIVGMIREYGETELFEISLNIINEKASYKLYRGQYFIMIPQDEDSSIYDGLKSLQTPSEHDFIISPMDSSIEFSTEEDGDRLIIHFDEETLDRVNISRQMVESILLTAKSYDYSEVLFKGMPINAIDGYDFRSAISVPLAANPLN